MSEAFSQVAVHIHWITRAILSKSSAALTSLTFSIKKTVKYHTVQKNLICKPDFMISLKMPIEYRKLPFLKLN